MLVDAETLEPARDGFSRVFGEATERIKPELFESFVEITTPVVETAEQAEVELRALREEVAERAAAGGLAVLATGSHPTARERMPIVPVDRYRAIDLGNAGVIQSGQRARLTFETLKPFWVADERVGQDLQCDVAIELGVPGAKHQPHPTFADLGDDLVDADTKTGSEWQRWRLYAA